MSKGARFFINCMEVSLMNDVTKRGFFLEKIRLPFFLVKKIMIDVTQKGIDKLILYSIMSSVICHLCIVSIFF